MSKKSKTTNKVDFAQPTRTREVDNLQGLVDQSVDYQTPIRNAYSRAEQENSRSYNNPLGSFTTADVRDKSMRAQNANFHQNLGMDLATAAQQNASDKFGRQATVAGLTQPQMYNKESVNKISDPWGTAIGVGQMASSLGTAAMG